MLPRHASTHFRASILFVLITFLCSLLPTAPLVDALSFSSETAELDAPGGSLPSLRDVDAVETKYGLVALLVDEDLWGSSSSGSGWFSFFGNTGLAAKIQSYAADVQAALPWTKTLIVKVSGEDTPVEIQRLLEKLYFEGDPNDSDTTQLTGVVVIGGVPLPVVNKNGYRFVSMLPYTDFKDPSYVLDVDTQDFLPNAEAQDLQPEAWHGVIVPPLHGQDGVDLLSAFFDKNHAFHTGDADYNTFDEKAFISDFVTEESTINEVSYGAYQRFLNLWEEIAYYRYSSDLLTEVYTDMHTTMEEGDLLDNDGDGVVDEEANNGKDEDGDGLTDEDVGDGFYQIDNDEDGAVDEDNANDNNNDADWHIDTYRLGNGPYFEDRLLDEDPPGDTTGGLDANGDGFPDGDGCPGLCGVDDNGDGADMDNDGYPTGIEALYGSDWADERDPWISVMSWTNDEFGTVFTRAEDATDYLSEMFVDQFYGGLYKSPTCYAADGSYHAEWDDDEDGSCDEDGSTQLQLWSSPEGASTRNHCAYNDADCDGSIDEDPEGIQPTGLFDDVPDIQSKSILTGLIKRYAELFDQPQGVWNRILNGTGRYNTQYLNADGNPVNDYDSSVSLIAKKDEYVLQYLRGVNDMLESGVDAIVKDNLAVDIPIIGLMEITGTYTTINSDGEESDPVDVCIPGKAADLTNDACLQFFNSSETEFGRRWYNSVQQYILTPGAAGNIIMNGLHLWEINQPFQCTLFAGTDEEGGQLTQFNTMYSSEADQLSKAEIRDRKNCVPEYASYSDDIDELCSVATAETDIRSLGGAKVVEEDVTDDPNRWETGPEACFEFREWTTFVNYSRSNGGFNDWLTGKIRRFSRDSEGPSDPQSYQEFLDALEEKRNDYTPRPDESTLRKHFSELDIISSDADHTYTVEDLLEDALGSTAPNDDTIDTYLALHDGLSVRNPSRGENMDDVSRVDIDFNKYYYDDNSYTGFVGTADFTSDLAEAKKISSYYKHTEPQNDTLSAQVKSQVSPDMPIDATRRASFIDGANQAQTLEYVNVFDAMDRTDVEVAIDRLALEVGNVEGGESFEGTIEGLGERINWGQLEDALAWYHMSIDEKHRYLLTHYLGEEEPVAAKARHGYEIAYIVANGEADQMQFAFNGNKPASEGDLEWLYRSAAAAEEALADEEYSRSEEEALSELSNTTPVPLGQWITAIQKWIQELNDSVSNFGTYGDGMVCGVDDWDTLGSSSGGGDANDDGVPDAAAETTMLILSSEDNSVLEADGKGLYVVTVSAEKADGSLNVDDAYTQVQLEILSGENSITIGGSSILPLGGGTATFALFSAAEGDFVVQAKAVNRNDVASSNRLSGSVVSKILKVTSYVNETEDGGSAISATEGSRIQVKDDEGNIVAVLDPETGDLELHGAEAVPEQASSGLPTRVAIRSAEKTHGVFFLIPDEKDVALGDGAAGVFVNGVSERASARIVNESIALETNGVQMGLVTPTGQIALSSGYSLHFENPGEINLYAPLHIKDGRSNDLFTVTIKHRFTTGTLLTPSGIYVDYLSFLHSNELIHESWLASLKTFFLPNAVAVEVIPDSDEDGLDDLEEWTIGTLLDSEDSDGDSYIDSQEVYAGYDPLAVGKKLFTDIDAGHPAYAALATLYLRGVVKGYSDGSFRPDALITREEFVKIDLGAICQQCDRYSEEYTAQLMAEYLPDAFPDQDINPELLACVAEAKVTGIVSGYAGGEDAGRFVPQRNISRAEATKVLIETGGYDVPSTTTDEVWYSEYVKVAQQVHLFPNDAVVNDAWLQASITRGEFVMMALNLVKAKDCRSVDSDGDGLADTEEAVLYATDPFLTDTDKGGVGDFEEIVRGSDPLDPDDDFPPEDTNDFSDFVLFDHEPGLYVVSDEASYESVSSSLGEGSVVVPVYTTELPADGISVVTVRAEIRDQSGDIYIDDDSSIVEFRLSSSDYGLLDSTSVQVMGGIAETVFKSSRVAGTVTVEAALRDGSLASQEQMLQVYAGTPSALELHTQSTVLPAGGEASNEMSVSLYDAFGNLSNHGFTSVTLSVQDGLTLLDLEDEDSRLDGTQITTPDGQFPFRVLSAAEPGTYTVTAALTDSPDIRRTLNLEVVEGMTLSIIPSSPFMLVGGRTPQTVNIEAIDADGTVVGGYQGEVNLSLSDPSYGSFSVHFVNLVNGQATVELTPGSLAGKGSLLVSSTGLSSGSVTMEFKPAETYELRVRSEDGSPSLSAGGTTDFIVEAYDVYGNFVNTDSTTTGTLRLTETTSAYGTLSSPDFTLNQGAARFSVSVGTSSGTLNIVASALDLLAGTWGGDVNYTMNGADFVAIQPQMLYANVLGGPFGDVTTENYIGGWMTFNGKTQAVNTLLSESSPQKPLASIDAHGAIALSKDGLVSQTVLGAGSHLPLRIQWRSLVDDHLLAEIFFALSSLEDIQNELLVDDSIYRVDSSEATLLLRENSTGVVKVRSDGQVEILDPAYTLSVNAAADGLSLIVSKNAQQIWLLNFIEAWDEDLELLDFDFDMEDWSTLGDGLYIRPDVAYAQRFVSMPTGNSTANARGLALVDPNQELPEDMRPSLGYASTENAENDGTIGFERENKNVLLFSAGNSVGQSTLYYPSEVSVVLGDPTVSLVTPNEVNELGYTEDIGTLVDTSPDDLLQLLSLDYNGDEQKDVLVVHESGSIDLLQNYQAHVRLQSRGELLNIENGISSIDSGDFNGDGLDDLFIVTKNPCYADEMCSYVYENIGGGFVAHNLSLEGLSGEPTQVDAVDLNGDHYDDLVLADENMIVYVVWNKEGTLEDVDEIKNFGLSTDTSSNLYADIAVHYEGLEEGSIGLSLLSDDLTKTSDAIDSDLEAFIEEIQGDPNFTVEVNGSGSVNLQKDTVFEYADQAAIANQLQVTKTVSDENGGSVELGDPLETTIVLQNVSGAALSDVYVADSISGFYTLDSDSLVCDNCAFNNESARLQKGDLRRPFIFGPLSLGPTGTITFHYRLSVTTLPKLSLMVGQDLYNDYTDDDFPDLGVSLEGNTGGELQLYYSDGFETISSGGFLGLGASSYKRINYREKEYSTSVDADSSAVEVEGGLTDANEDGVPDFIENMDPTLGVPVPEEGSYDFVKENLGGSDKDSNGYYSPEEMFSSDTDVDDDGLSDTIDDVIGILDLNLDPTLSLEGDTISLEAELSFLDEGLSMLTEKVDALVSTLTCGGGCISFVGSIAFLAPGQFHEPTTGAYVGTDIGTPIFGIVPGPPFVCAGTACIGSSILRFYIAPTTTLGLGMGICAAPYGGACIAFNIPLLQLLGVCDAINGFVTDSLSKATAFISGEDGGTTAYNVPPSQSGNDDSVGLESSVFSSYVPKTSTQKNIEVPGFPAVFTEWWKAQKQEFFKMLDLPDVTFIYPDPKSVTTEFTGIREKALENKAGEVIDLDQQTKVDELTSGALGLEKFLNWAHSLPLIDIKTEKVYVRYPAITQEEKELMRQDAEQWLRDTKASWAAFEAQFATLDEDAQREGEGVKNEVERAVNEAIQAVENYLAVVESYSHIPEEILKIREAQASYAKIIICYLDAILQYTAGYLKENAQRVQAWGQWAVDLRKVVDGWRVLIDVSKNFMDSCDKCTNQRWNGLQLLFSLFVFVPDFPVVELPKLPDIIIDVSHIQAGVDIVWPDIQFIPERITPPKLPRFVFPSVNIDLNAELNLDFKIPELPSFNFNVQFPQLPALTLPELPTLPPPPSVPDIDPELKVSMKIASSVLKIICIIREGFFPTWESNLKSKIEDMTERSSTILPFDLKETVEWPSFHFDFLKNIQIDTYLNLTADFSGLYDIVENLGDQTSELSGDLSEAIEVPFQNLSKEIQDALTTFGNEEVDVDVHLQGDESSSVNEVTRLAQHYSQEPLVSDRIVALKNSLLELQKTVDEWSATLPGDILLTATERTLALNDPLLNRYDEIAAGESALNTPEFLENISGTPLASVKQLKDSMVAYVDELDRGTTRMKGMGSDAVLEYVAYENQKPVYSFASLESEGVLSTGSAWTPEEDVTEDLDIELSSDGSPEGALEGLNLGLMPQASNTGLYLYNAVEGVSTRLIAYTQEAEKETHILMIDIDNDGDDDIVYSMGGDVYVKENHTETARVEYVSSDPTVTSVNELSPAYGNVKNFKRGKNDYQQASFSFNEAPAAVGYEVHFYDSLDAAEAAPDEDIKHLLLLNEEQNSYQDFFDADGKTYSYGAPFSGQEAAMTYQTESGAAAEVPESASSDAPGIYESRLIATTVSGSVKLKNAAQRTFIAENGELQMDEGVLFQSTESTDLKVIEDGFTVTYHLPAYTVIDLGVGHDRTLRVESGSVYWVDPTQMVSEQDLLEDMEILPEEIVHLEGNAEALLRTSEGASISLDKEELFVMDRLMDPERPSSQVDLENGAYYTLARGIFSDGSTGVLSQTVLLNPQVCADDSSPFPIISQGRSIDLAIFATTTLSAESSFDSESGIVDAYWDLDASIDENTDGDPTNDSEIIGLTALIGPYDSTDTRTVTLHVTDGAGNTATSTIEVHIYVPDIHIAEATPEHVNGDTAPASPRFPFHLVRDRDGALQELGDGYDTDESGAFDIDMNDSDLISVYDGNGDTIAQFNPRTKQIIVFDEAYDISFVSADANWPSRLVVYEKSTGAIMASFVFVTDSSLPIVTLSQSLTEYDLSTLNRVAVHFVEGQESYESGATQITAHDAEGNLDFSLTNAGNITVFDPTRYTVVREPADSLDDYLVLNVYDQGTLEMQIWPGSSPEVYLNTADGLDLPPSTWIETGPSLSADTHLYFEDISTEDPLFSSIEELVERGVLQGYEENGKRYFKPEESINRAEFAKIILGILCIVPSDEAQITPTVFNDILDPNQWYYSYTKEAFLRRLITGYLGELDSEGIAPFKPAHTITTAEGVKIMLEALHAEKIITLPKDLFAEPWYTRYMEIAQDLTPYMNDAETAGSDHYIITAEEAAQPNHVLTRYEFVEMSVRVLQAYNCFDLDSDGDGLINYDEESFYGSDPYNPDTDAGGVDDGTEVRRGTDPLDGNDDFGEGSLNASTPGIYAITEACMACPCVSQIDYSADLRAGDQVFAIIQNAAGEIFGKSNTVTVTSE